MTALSAQDRHVIDLARQLAALATVAAVREHASTDDTTLALAHFWGAARVSLADLAAVAERLGDDEGQADEDTRRLGESRATVAAFDEVARILAAFDCEHDDRQLALEAIERVVLTGGQP